MFKKRSLSAACVFLVAATGQSALSTNEAPSNNVAPIGLERNVIRGVGLEPIAPYKTELTVSGLQKLSAHELFSGAFTIDVWETQDGGRLLLKDYPFDQYVQVLHGSTTLTSNAGSSRSFVAGDSFVVPRGFKGTWTLSKGFREILIIESKTLKEGIGQFE